MHEYRATGKAVEAGGKARVKPSYLRAQGLSSDPKGEDRVVVSVSEGGTVTLRSAVHGFRCWDIRDMEVAP